MEDNDNDLPTFGVLDTAAAQQLLDTLDAVGLLDERVRSSRQLPVHPLSRLAADQGVGNAASGYNVASVTVASVIDHLHTWHQLFAGDLNRFPLPIMSHYTLARSVCEASLWTLWLLDPAADSAGRVSRGYALQLMSLDDMRKYQVAAGIAGAQANAAGLHQRLWRAAQSDGFVQVTESGRERLTVQPPTMIELFDRYGSLPASGVSAAWRYRLLSGFTHGREWAVLGASADLTGSTEEMNLLRPNLPLLHHLAQYTIMVADRAITTYIDHRTAADTAGRS